MERGGREDAWFGEIVKEEKELQRKERWERSNESKYNRWYREVQGEEIPGYLKKGWGENRWRKVARFRLGCEVRGEGTEKDRRK